MEVYRILLVDDDDDWLQILKDRLDPERYRVFYAPNAEKAIEAAVRANPDLAILDIRLPDLSGHELCARVRGIPGLERLPIIAWSAFPIEKIRSLNIGADGFVSKASGKSDLRASIEALLRRVALDTGVLIKGDLRLDPRGNLVLLDGEAVAALTRKEFLFFYAIVKKSPEAVSRQELRDHILHQDGDVWESRALEMLVTRTRKRLGQPLSERIRGSRRFGWVYLPDPGRRAATGSLVVR